MDGASTTLKQAPKPSLDKALVQLDQILATVRPDRASVQPLALIEALDRIVAEPLSARADNPPHDYSAMDGYALSTAVLAGEGPWSLPVLGRLAAGAADNQVDDTSTALAGAIRIFTGATIPAGTDAVVMQEAVSRTETATGPVIMIEHRPRTGDNIRRAGEDMARGDLVAEPGQIVTPGLLAALAASGHKAVPVYPPVRVAVLTTGAELRPPGATLEPGQIWNSNLPMLTGLLARPTVSLVAVEHAPDDLNVLKARLATFAGQADLIVTTGGVSVGEADLVRPAVVAAGGSVSIDGVAMKPGKPSCVGQIGGACWLGLPGNPLSVLVSWIVFGEPLLARLSGGFMSAVLKARAQGAVLESGLRYRPGRTELRLGRIIGHDPLGRAMIRCPDVMNSGLVSNLIAAHGLLIMPADGDTLAAGAVVDFLPLPCRHDTAATKGIWS